MKVERRWVTTGLPLGPLLALGGYAALSRTDVTITDELLIGIVAFPTALLLVVAAIAATLRRDAGTWLSMALGATIGTALAVGIVVGGISLIAFMLSDPG